MMCQVCSKEFISKRTDAKYCSQPCQKKAKRLSRTPKDKLSRTSDNPIVDTYKGLPITKEGAEALKDPVKWFSWLCDNYSAEVIHALGFTPPKWKKQHSDKAEVINSLEATMKKKLYHKSGHGMWIKSDDIGDDYKTWK